MRVLLLSRYGRLGASSRVRSFQYLPFLESKGWTVDVRPLFSDRYLQALYGGESRGITVLAGYWHRLQVLLQVKRYDFVWIEKEIFPFIPAFVERLILSSGVTYVVDYDDALFHRYDKNRNRFIRLFLSRKIDTVMRCAALVIAGNEYLADRARLAGAKRVEIIPTVVDLCRYSKLRLAECDMITVGWIGSPSTSHYLVALGAVIKSLVRGYHVRFVAVGAGKQTLEGLPVEVWEWSEETEVESIQKFDIGIMPLENSPWERGKCGYKLIQYMACGVPVVASPVGVNQEIVKHGDNGFLAQDLHEWEQALQELLNNQELRRQMGGKGRKLVETSYSIQVQAPRLESLMRGVLR